jgi:hypothetical protein
MTKNMWPSARGSICDWIPRLEKTTEAQSHAGHQE